MLPIDVHIIETAMRDNLIVAGPKHRISNRRHTVKHKLRRRTSLRTALLLPIKLCIKRATLNGMSRGNLVEFHEAFIVDPACSPIR